MFNWICPQCGQEVLSSYAECPNCAKAAAAQVAEPQPQAQVQPQAQMQPQAPPVPPQAPPQQPLPPREPPRSAFLSAPPVQPPMQAPQYYAQPPQYYAQPPQRSGMPTWLMSILFAGGFILFGWGVYWLINHNKGDSGPSVSAITAPVDPKAKPNPYQKFIEITGIRLYQDPKKKVAAHFLLVNHMDGEMTDIAGNVDIRGRTAKEGEEPVGTFQFKIPSVGPNEAKEVTVPVDTKLKVYELPDWQMIDVRLQLTSPK